MKEQNKIENVFNSIATKWNSKEKLISNCIGNKSLFKTEYKNWIHNGMKILDVGCGTGKKILRINNEYQDCELYGIDMSEKMIEIAKENIFQSQNIINFIKVDFIKFNVEKKYNVIIFNYVLHHMDNPTQAIEKAFQLLEPNGLIIITVPGTEYLKETFTYSSEFPNDVIGRFSQTKVESIFSSFDLVQLLYKKSTFLMQFESYNQYIQYLKSIGTYQKIVNYSTKKWRDEFNQLVMKSYHNAKNITGNYDMYIYCKVG